MKMRWITLFAASLVFLLAPLLQIAQQVHPDYHDGRIFLKIDLDQTTPLPEWQAGQSESVLPHHPQVRDLIAGFAIRRIEKTFRSADPRLNNIWEITFSHAEEVSAFIHELEAISYVTYAERVPLMRLDYNPDDVNFLQWHLNTIDAAAAWDITTGNPNVVVAIVDDAMRTSHEDLAPRVYVNPGEIPGNGLDDDGNGYIDDVSGWDAADNDNDPTPPAGANDNTFSHGTHVGGIAGAATDNGVGIASVGFNVSLLPCKSKLDSTIGNNLLDNTYRALEYAMLAGADVANMSFGGTGFSFTYQSLVNVCHDSGLVMIASAGNDGNQVGRYPASYNHVISVGSTDLNDNKSSFSNYHQTTDVMAPGSFIYSTLAGADDSYGFNSGTSMSAPVVSGLAGLVRSLDSTLTPDEVEAFIKCGCENIDSQNPDYVGFMGAGRVNAANTLDCILNPVAVDPENEIMQLGSVFPNPTSGIVHVKAHFSARTPLDIAVYDLAGSQVATLFHGEAAPGAFHLNTQIPESLVPGLYLIKIEGAGFSITRKLEVLR